MSSNKLKSFRERLKKFQSRQPSKSECPTRRPRQGEFNQDLPPPEPVSLSPVDLLALRTLDARYGLLVDDLIELSPVVPFLKEMNPMIFALQSALRGEESELTFWLEAAHRRFGDCGPYFLRAGIANALVGKLWPAQKAFHRWATREPGHAEAHYLLGCFSLVIGDLENGYYGLERAVLLRPSFADAYLELISLALMVGNDCRALELLEKVQNYKGRETARMRYLRSLLKPERAC